MILGVDKLLGRFRCLLKTCTHVDIATAWATLGEHARILADAKKEMGGDLKIRAIVGTSGNATHPDALKELYRITDGDLKIIKGSGHLFHPKLYLFQCQTNGSSASRAWVGSANLTNRGFGGHANANEEIILETCERDQTKELDKWFRKRWCPLSTDRPVEDMIREYEEDWKRNPPHRRVRQLVSGPASQRRDLLGDLYRPLSFRSYLQALKECEEMLGDQEWKVFGLQSRSYMNAISHRRKLLFGEIEWKDLDRMSERQLRGGEYNSDLNWWGLLGRSLPIVGTWSAMCDHEDKIRCHLKRVRKADDKEFPEIAVTVMQDLIKIRYISIATATLLLTLARPDRLVSLNARSENGLSALLGNSDSTLDGPEDYGKLLQWLYDEDWYKDSKPTNEDLLGIWRCRAALVDAFVYEPQ